ncbi:hypothetical protein KEK_10087 [Mycolicibacterium thermoresistibile ATCC 19527]|jgi:hypothetical protein|uniref:Uncharacterized protein n=1 Tax=Mycolicibacterium thermoresistibile (strain ATCC 19527 / DSM 44167 / CIP 105390 / JCM 6362 / NCTC 10409 / 316) TaxID=1078020 RepID=G7CG91_MYCT3|nr:hypothetical protein KEK_10087 [Mycolicibacterium thermoresistibile ATCC 19527]
MARQALVSSLVHLDPAGIRKLADDLGCFARSLTSVSERFRLAEITQGVSSLFISHSRSIRSEPDDGIVAR